MSKKKGGKKNQNLDEFEEESKPAKDVQSVKPSKVKSKKGKNKKDDDWSDGEKAAELNLKTAPDKEPAKVAKPVAAAQKKSKAKKGKGKNDGDWSDNEKELDLNVKDVSDEDLVVGPVKKAQKKCKYL